MIDKGTLLRHYKREFIQKAMSDHAKNKEIAVRYNEQFGKRPDVLNYPRDVLELAINGATSFHASEELWQNPLRLNPNLNKQDLNDLRTGWDLVLDVDCDNLEYSKIATDIIVKALRHHQINSFSVKYSGNKGFHIGVPFEAFPEAVAEKETRLMFPEAPRKVAAYLKDMIQVPVGKNILKYENNNFSAVIEKTGKKPEEILLRSEDNFGRKVENLNAEPFLNIDTILISPRHLYRMPYSLHEKSGLVSIPINPDKILEFDKETASPEKITDAENVFINRIDVKHGEAKQLLLQAFDFAEKNEPEKIYETEIEIPEEAIPQKFFPPCIKKILEGMKDGRKRAVFVLINFLRSCGYDYDSIEKILKEWNERNPEPLKEQYWLGQLRYHKQNKKKILPPNCDNAMYFSELGIDVCKRDNLHRYIKNPVQWAKKKAKFNE